MSEMFNEETLKSLEKTRKAALLWVLLVTLVLGGATYAWFTFSLDTNVKPMAGTIGNGGASLLISNQPDGTFKDYTELIPKGNGDNIQPVSTADCREWFTAVSHDYSGISNRFRTVTDTIDDLTISGEVYLKTEGGSCDVYLNDRDMKFNADDQILSAGRLALKMTIPGKGTKTVIFNFDSIVNSNLNESAVTTAEENAVISDITADGTPYYVSDPSVPFTDYTILVQENGFSAGKQPLFRLAEEETATVAYCFYMEGCDRNAVNAAQDRFVEFSLAFAGIGITERQDKQQ